MSWVKREVVTYRRYCPVTRLKNKKDNPTSRVNLPYFSRERNFRYNDRIHEILTCTPEMVQRYEVMGAE